MTLRKLIFDNSVKYVTQSERTQNFSKDFKSNLIEKVQFFRNKTKNFHKILKKLLQKDQDKDTD